MGGFLAKNGEKKNTYLERKRNVCFIKVSLLFYFSVNDDTPLKQLGKYIALKSIYSW